MKLSILLAVFGLAIGTAFAEVVSGETESDSKVSQPPKYASKINVETFPYARYAQSLSKSTETVATPPLRRLRPYTARTVVASGSDYPSNSNSQYFNDGFSTSYTTTQNGDSAPITTYSNSKYQSSNDNPNGIRYTNSGNMYGRHPMEAYHQAMIDQNMRMSMDMIPRSINIPMPVMVPVPMHIPMPMINIPPQPTHYDPRTGQPCRNYQKSCVNGRCVASCNGETYASSEDTDDK
uniref:WAP domain-containing protein n=1 Tax=Panagrellus redivivus TaxID=6233 RepID=A0A7E4VVD7_PANRE